MTDFSKGERHIGAIKQMLESSNPLPVQELIAEKDAEATGTGEVSNTDPMEYISVPGTLPPNIQPERRSVPRFKTGAEWRQPKDKDEE